MKKKYPIHLPGKELWDIHFDPVAAAKLGGEEIGAELAPLWAAVVSKKLAPPEAVEKWSRDCNLKRTQQAWESLQTMCSRINWKRPEESGAGAGWLLLKNLQRAVQILQGYLPPCPNLENPTWAGLEIAVILSTCLVGEKEHTQRLILHAILQLIPETMLEGIGREIMGADSIGMKGNQLRICISHGKQDGQVWKKSPEGKVRIFLEELKKKLPAAEKAAIKRLEILGNLS